jgi:hypothetical protein
MFYNYYKRREAEANKKAVGWSILTAAAVGMAGYFSHKTNRDKVKKVIDATKENVEKTVDGIDFEGIKVQGESKIKKAAQFMQSKTEEGISFAESQVASIQDKFDEILHSNDPKTVSVKPKSTKSDPQSSKSVEKQAEEFANGFDINHKTVKKDESEQDFEFVKKSDK